MPDTLTENDLRTYRISYEDRASEETRAAYFVSDDEFANFKNHNHKVVFAARLFHIVSIRDITDLEQP